MANDRIGIGASPLGVGPYGLGTVAVAPELGGAVHTAPNGKQYGSVLVSLSQGSVGQYVFDQYGRRTGQPDVRHMVTLVLATIRGSSAANIGHRFRELRKVNDSYPQEVKTRVEEALGPILQRGLISLDSVSVDGKRGSPAETRVFMTDLTNGVVFEELI